MPSYIPRNLHECTCRGCGRPRPGRPRLPGVPGPGARIPPQGRQEGRGKALRPPARDGAHPHEPRHPKTPGHQTGPSGTCPKESVHSPRAVLGKQAPRPVWVNKSFPVSQRNEWHQLHLATSTCLACSHEIMEWLGLEKIFKIIMSVAVTP